MKKLATLFVLIGLFMVAQTAFAATFVVDSNLDTSDSNQGDGICGDSNGDCTLRAAIQEANAQIGADTINFSITGTISVTQGPLEITDDSLTLNGPGITGETSSLVIDGTGHPDNDLAGRGLLVTSDNNNISGLEIKNFIYNLYLDGANSNTFSNIILRESTASGAGSFEALNSDNNTVTNSFFLNSGIGIRFNNGSDFNEVSESVSRSNLHSGMTSFDSTGNIFRNNTIDSNDNGMYLIFAVDTLVEGNTIIDSVVAGINIFETESVNNVIQENTIEGGPSCIFVGQGAENVSIINNTITDCSFSINFDNTITGDYLIEGNDIQNGSLYVFESSGDFSIIDNTIDSDGSDIGDIIDIQGNGSNVIILRGNSITGGVGITDVSQLIVGGVLTDQGNIFFPNQNGNGITIDLVDQLEMHGNIAGFLPDTITPAETSFDGTVISLSNISSATIGGSSEAHRNVFGGSELITVFIGNSENVIMSGNSIGVGIDLELKNESPIGILIVDSVVTVTNNTVTSGFMGVYVIGSLPGDILIQENTIFDSSLYGILVGATTIFESQNDNSYATIIGNSIYNIGEYAIAFGLDSDADFIVDNVDTFLENDLLDTDVGFNDYLNHPLFISASPEVDDLNLSYTVDVPVGTYRVDFFTNPESGPVNNYDQGKIHKGFEEIIIASSGQKTLTQLLSNVSREDNISATITKCLDEDCLTYGATSRFSRWTTDYSEPVEDQDNSNQNNSGSIITTTGKIRQQTSPEKIIGSGQCPAHLVITNFLKQGDRDGNYSKYYKNTITEVKILQAHINRILINRFDQASGPEDGIFGRKTKLGVVRLQLVLNDILKPTPILKIDGIVGPFTRAAINNSCGSLTS